MEVVGVETMYGVLAEQGYRWEKIGHKGEKGVQGFCGVEIGQGDKCGEAGKCCSWRVLK